MTVPAESHADNLADGGDLRLVRHLLVQYGGSALSHMATWRGNRYWFTGDRRAGVAYRLVGRVALTVGDPIGDPAGMAAALAGFNAFCVAAGLLPCMFSITEGAAAYVSAGGWRLLHVGDEARIALAPLRFTGRRWQDVRTALNRARREGVTARWVCYPRAPYSVAEQIRSICAAWVADKGVPEMTFTLGGVEELRDDTVRCLVAEDSAGRVQAVTSWLPVYRNGVVVGWTLDLMRRHSHASNGIVEFLIASASLQFKQEGAEFVSLSGTPLAHAAHQDGASPAQRILYRAGQLIEPVYGLSALLAFKAKFQPVYRPLYVAYPAATALPRIALATIRAYLPDLTTRQALRLGAAWLRGRRQPGTGPVVPARDDAPEA
jgi:lysylphosphatidylglycerol synthetase-like protein (DUF2156 family)